MARIETAVGRGTVNIVHGNALALPLPDECVDLIVTSPPYFGLRSYKDHGGHYSGQVGSEATPGEFVDALVTATREMRRVLKPSGSIWVNLGDKYSRGARPRNQPDQFRKGAAVTYDDPKYVEDTAPEASGIRGKSLMGLPWRYAIRCIDDLDLILRSELVWCLSGDTPVYARTPDGDGPVALRDLVASRDPSEVQLWNGVAWTRVLGWNRADPGDAGAVRFEVASGQKVECLPGHRWPTRRGLVRADELKVGDVIDSVLLPQPGTPCPEPDGRDRAWLVGLYLACGSREGDNVVLTLSTAATDRLSRLSRAVVSFGGAMDVIHHGDRPGASVMLSGPVADLITKHVVDSGDGARLAPSVWRHDNGFLAAVLDGYFSGAADRERGGEWLLKFVGRDGWASDLRTLAARFGAELRLHHYMHAGVGELLPGWRGHWSWPHPSRRRAEPDGRVACVRSCHDGGGDFYDLGVDGGPHLFALASGLLSHNSKPNGIPESVRDRVRRSHEQWFHFTKEPRYYSSVDLLRQPHKGMPGREGKGALRGQKTLAPTGPNSGTYHPLGRLPGSVWDVAVTPLRVPKELGIDHFASFPVEWPKRLITGWCPQEVCTRCGQGRRPVIASTRLVDGEPVEGLGRRRIGGYQSRPSGIGNWRYSTRRELAGWVCGCPDTSAPTVRGLVLDPFGGSGTTALAASVLGRDAITVDLSEDYCRLARWRVNDPAQVAKAAGRKHRPGPAGVTASPRQRELF